MQAIIDRITEIAKDRPDLRVQVSKKHLLSCNSGCKVERECKHKEFRGGKFVEVGEMCLVRAGDFVEALNAKQRPPVKS